MSDGGEGFEFAMGEHVAWFPNDRGFGRNHMWAMDRGGGRTRLGLTAYAVRLLQDVYFLDWTVDAGQTLTRDGSIGCIESKKAESDLYVPGPCRLATINDEVLDEPSLINADPYGDGWLIEVDRLNPAVLLSPDSYAGHLRSAWEVAQRTIKGQANV